ncbi:MAG: hypothetical protein AB2689_20490 [Candidatus Thiodiazotropha taylori]
MKLLISIKPMLMLMLMASLSLYGVAHSGERGTDSEEQKIHPQFAKDFEMLRQLHKAADSEVEIPVEHDRRQPPRVDSVSGGNAEFQVKPLGEEIWNQLDMQLTTSDPLGDYIRELIRKGAVDVCDHDRLGLLVFCVPVSCRIIYPNEPRAKGKICIANLDWVQQAYRSWTPYRVGREIELDCEWNDSKKKNFKYRVPDELTGRVCNRSVKLLSKSKDANSIGWVKRADNEETVVHMECAGSYFPFDRWGSWVKIDVEYLVLPDDFPGTPDEAAKICGKSSSPVSGSGLACACSSGSRDLTEGCVKYGRNCQDISWDNCVDTKARCNSMSYLCQGGDRKLHLVEDVISCM